MAAAFEGSSQRELVCVLEVAPNREPARDPRYLYRKVLEEARQVQCRRVALDVRVGAQDHFLHPLDFDPAEELPHAQLLGADPVDRADRPLEHVVPPPELGSLFDRDEVARFFHDAQEGRVPPGVCADPAFGALPTLCDVETTPAPGDFRLGGIYRRRKAGGIFGGRLEDVKSNALSGLWTNAREAAKLVDQILDGGCVHWFRRPGQSLGTLEVCVPRRG